MPWVLTPALVSLNEEIARVAAARDTRSDGTVGDQAHALVVSDHNPDETGAVPIRDADSVNEVHASDRDSTGPWPWAGGMETLVQFLVDRCRRGVENRLRYIIFNGRIWRASNGWRQETYTGSNRHTEHAHFSGSYSAAAERDTRPWGLEDIPMALTNEDREWIEDVVAAGNARLFELIEKRVGDVVRRVDADGADVPADDPNPNITVSTALSKVLRDTAVLRKQTAPVTPPPEQ